MMKSTGIVRKVDELGRIVLPVELRRALGIDVKDPVEVFVEGERIILQKYMPNAEKQSVIEELQAIVSKVNEPDRDILQRAINLIK